MRRITALWLSFLIVLAVPSFGAAESFVELRAKAEKGDALSQLFTGVAYRSGEGVAKNPTEAIKWFRMAADQGQGVSQGFLGEMYLVGEGVAKNPAEAVKWFRKAADQGSTSAQCTLGTMYATGNGVARNPTEAVKWYRMAAKQSDAEAQFHLGVMYDFGRGVAKDPPEAAKWYRMAAEQGTAEAQFNLGAIYAKGDGVLKDEIEALAWFNLSAISGFKDAANNRDIFERRLGQQMALVAQQRSRELLKQIESNKAARRAALAAGNTDAPPSALPTNNHVPKASGSGTIISVSGYVLTAAHVIADAVSITVITAHGMKTATVVRLDESNDLAVLKIADGAYAALPVSASRPVRLGQSVATIGFPNVGIQGFSPKLTRGEISSLNGVGDDPRAWQISVPVQMGNSGGPLLDENGNLIGVVVAKLGLKAARATGDLPQNVGYAVKSAYALPLLEPYLDSGAPAPNRSSQKPNFEDMVANAQQSVVLILVY